MLDDGVIREVLARALATGGEFAEVYAEDRTGTSIRVDDRRVEEVTSGRDRGAGIRVIRGAATAYSFTNRLDRASLLDAAAAAAAGFREEPRATVTDLRRAPERTLNTVGQPPAAVSVARKVEAVRRIDDEARAQSGDIRQVTVSFAEGEQRVLIAASDGTLAEDTRVRTRVSCAVVAARDGIVTTGHHGPGASSGFELLERETPEEIARRAARQALTMLDARPAPAGEMPAVLAPGGGGVLFHEACGHGLEADLIDKRASVYAGCVGQVIGSDLVTGIDSGAEPGAWGSFAYDDEGQPSQRTMLIEKGVLASYMTDRLRAGRLGAARTGNGRRQSYAHLPIPRMTNSQIMPGGAEPAEIVRGVKRGLYAKSFGGGQVNPATGDFVFGLTEAYLIENGEIAYPVRGANLIGNGPQILARIDAVGSDFDTWTGMCGKDGQGVPVTVGMPTARISLITIGGTG